jgi:hypothetical protein
MLSVNLVVGLVIPLFSKTKEFSICIKLKLYLLVYCYICQHSFTSLRIGKNSTIDSYIHSFINLIYE